MDFSNFEPIESAPAAVARPVAVLKFERGAPGRENEMSRVVSCNWMPDGEYEVYFAAAPTAQPAPASATRQAAPASVLHLVHSAFAEIAMAFPKAFALHKVSIADTAVREALAALIARTTQPAPQQEPVEMPAAIEQMATGRYKVVPSHESMFHRWAVVAGTGAQQLYLGREVECQNMARKFAGAFLDGVYVALRNAAPQPSPAVQGDALDAARWRRLVNASEMAFPVAAIADDPENDGPMLYGRKRMEALIDSLDEIPSSYAAAALAAQGDTQ